MEGLTAKLHQVSDRYQLDSWSLYQYKYWCPHVLPSAVTVRQCMKMAYEMNAGHEATINLKQQVKPQCSKTSSRFSNEMVWKLIAQSKYTQMLWSDSARRTTSNEPINVWRSHATSESLHIMRLSSVSGSLILNSIVHDWGFSNTPLMNPMSFSGLVGSRTRWKAQRIRSELMNTDLCHSKWT